MHQLMSIVWPQSQCNLYKLSLTVATLFFYESRATQSVRAQCGAASKMGKKEKKKGKKKINRVKTQEEPEKLALSQHLFVCIHIIWHNRNIYVIHY